MEYLNCLTMLFLIQEVTVNILQSLHVAAIFVCFFYNRCMLQRFSCNHRIQLKYMYEKRKPPLTLYRLYPFSTV